MDRREFLGRASALTAAGLVTGMAEKESAVRVRQSQSTPETREPIRLDHVGGKIWAWHRTITGTCLGIPGDATVGLLVNGEAVTAVRAGDRFGATVRLAPGENEVSAVATLASGDQIVSGPVTHTVRLSPRPTSRITLSVEGDTVILDSGKSQSSELDGSPIAVILNFSPGDLDASVSLSAEFTRSSLTDLWTDETFAAPGDGALAASIPAWGSASSKPTSGHDQRQ